MTQRKGFNDFFTFTRDDKFIQNKTYLIHLMQLVESMDENCDMSVTSTGRILMLFFEEDGMSAHIDVNLDHILTYIDRLLKLQAHTDFFTTQVDRDKIYECFTINE